MKLKSPEFDSKKMPINFKLTYMDQWVDNLLSQERVVDIILPRMISRQLLIQKGEVQPRKYYVEAEESEADEESDYQSDSD